MSDRTNQTLANLTYEVLSASVQMQALLERLNQMAPTIVSAQDVQTAQQRAARLRVLLKSLQSNQKR